MASEPAVSGVVRPAMFRMAGLTRSTARPVTVMVCPEIPTDAAAPPVPVTVIWFVLVSPVNWLGTVTLIAEIDPDVSVPVKVRETA